VAPNLLKQELDILIQFFDDLLIKLKTIMTGDLMAAAQSAFDLMIDAFWTIFDFSEAAILAAYDMFVLIFKEMLAIISSTIRIPFLTMLYEVFAEQDFSVLNCATFIMAGLMNVIYAVKGDQLPFDVIGDPSVVLKDIPDNAVDLGGIFGVKTMTTNSAVALTNTRDMHALAVTDDGDSNGANDPEDPDYPDEPQPEPADPPATDSPATGLSSEEAEKVRIPHWSKVLKLTFFSGTQDLTGLLFLPQPFLE